MLDRIAKQVLEESLQAIWIGDYRRKTVFEFEGRVAGIDGVPRRCCNRLEVDPLVRFGDVSIPGQRQYVLDDPFHSVVGVSDMFEVFVVVLFTASFEPSGENEGAPLMPRLALTTRFWPV